LRGEPTVDKWKTEQASLMGAVVILNQLEMDGYEIRNVEIIKTMGLAPVQGVEPGVSGQGQVLGEFASFRVWIAARKRD